MTITKGDDMAEQTLSEKKSDMIVSSFNKLSFCKVIFDKCDSDGVELDISSCIGLSKIIQEVINDLCIVYDPAIKC